MPPRSSMKQVQPTRIQGVATPPAFATGYSAINRPHEMAKQLPNQMDVSGMQIFDNDMPVSRHATRLPRGLR